MEMARVELPASHARMNKNHCYGGFAPVVPGGFDQQLKLVHSSNPVGDKKRQRWLE